MPLSDRRDLYRRKGTSDQVSEKGGGGDITSPPKKRSENPINHSSDSESSRRRKRNRSLNSKNASRYRTQNVFRTSQHKQQREIGHGDIEPKKSAWWREKKQLIWIAVIIGLLLLLVILVTVVSLYSNKDLPHKSTIYGNISSIQQNKTYAAYLYKYNATNWNQTKGNCGLPKEEPDLSSRHYVDATEVVPHSWPWQVAIVRYFDFRDGYDTLTHLCGGTLVGPNVVITAASCFFNETYDSLDTSTQTLRAIVGAHKTLAPALEEGAKLAKISKIFLHPEQNLETFLSQQMFPNYDVAILILAIRFNPQQQIPVVGFACLPSPQITPPLGKRCWALGWGNSHNSLSSNVLKQFPQSIVSETLCKEHYGDFISHDKHLCVEERYVGACEGDVGGPLICLGEDSRWTLYGIISHTPGACITGPSVYTSIAMIVEWICCLSLDLAFCQTMPCKNN